MNASSILNSKNFREIEGFLNHQLEEVIRSGELGEVYPDAIDDYTELQRLITTNADEAVTKYFNEKGSLDENNKIKQNFIAQILALRGHFLNISQETAHLNVVVIESTNPE